MKLNYQNVEIKILFLENSDIVTNSGFNGPQQDLDTPDKLFES